MGIDTEDRRIHLKYAILSVSIIVKGKSILSIDFSKI